MTIVCEVVFSAPHASAAAAPQTAARLAHHWTTLPGLVALDFYAPAPDFVRDPYLRDEFAGGRLALLSFVSLDALDQAVHTASFAAGLSSFDCAALSCTAMQRSDHLVADETAPAAHTAPFSYVVRYHRPAADEAAFVKHYVEGHPPLLGRLPGVRNVICYVPLRWRCAGGPPSADYLIGNEVAFDHAEAFNAAMASAVRHELRAHYRTLPAFSGRDTHVAMRRTRLFG
jgi:uncharacterized protein (TIGR02118 family)